MENIFESRYRHLSEMERMGARVRIYEQTAVIEGVPQLHSAAVEEPPTCARARRW